MKTPIEQIRYLQKQTLKAEMFCQYALAEAGIASKSVKSIPKLIQKLGEEAALKAATAVFNKHSRAHTTFRAMEM